MRKSLLSLWAIILALPLASQERATIDIPDLPGYITLKCDFHLHTVFSDGKVWPTVRVDEAYRDGLDAIALADHLGRRHDEDIVTSRNRPYEIAADRAEAKGIILIKGSEISPSMPPGHHNTLFLSDADEVADKRAKYMEAFRAAKAQNAFIVWNHPGNMQQPDTTMWWPIHTQLYEEGMMHGIEVVNGDNYYPEAHRWALDKKLAMLGNSDAHEPIAACPSGKHRPMTLVFAKAKTPEAIREALDERRTAVYYREFVIGDEKYLKELFESAVEWKVEKTGKVVNEGEEVRVTVRNNSDLTIRLRKAAHDPRLVYFRNTVIPPYLTVSPHGKLTFTVRLLKGVKGGDVNFRVDNFIVQPDTGMMYTLKI